MNVEDHLPLHGLVEMNNQTTADTSELRAVVAANYDNLFDHLDALSLQYQASPQELREVGVFAASYTRRLRDAAQTRVAFTYIRSRSDVSTIGTLSVLGSGSIYGARMIRPLQLLPGTLTLGVDYKDFSEDIRLEEESGLQTAISYLNFSAGYTGGWSGESRQLGAGITFNIGTRGLANQPTEFENKRFKARPNYFYVRANADLVQNLAHGFSLLTALHRAVRRRATDQQRATGDRWRRWRAWLPRGRGAGRPGRQDQPPARVAAVEASWRSFRPCGLPVCRWRPRQHRQSPAR